MTVVVQTPEISYVGNGSTASFPVPFRYDNPADLLAVRVEADGTETQLTNGIDFTATPGATNSGGTLTTSLAPSAGARLTIWRATARAQTADYIEGGPFQAQSHERALDKAMLINQELDLDVARALLVPRGVTPPALTSFDEAVAGDVIEVTGPKEVGPVPYSQSRLAGAVGEAQAAAQVAAAYSGPIYASAAAGLAATTSGQEFAVDNGNGTATIYVNSAGVAVSRRTIIIAPSASSSSLQLGHITDQTGGAATTIGAELRALFIRPEGFTSLSQADAAAVTLGRPLLITQNIAIAANTTLGADLYFNGGRFTVASTFTLTLRGQVVNKDTTARLFYGAGSVVGLRFVRPEWWGAIADATGSGSAGTDNITALRAAHTCAMASRDARGDEHVIALGGGNYGVSDGWVVTPTADVNLRVRGAGTVLGGTRIIDLPAYDSTDNPVFQVKGNSGPIQRITDWEVSGLAVIKGGGSAVVGFQIGSNDAAERLIGVTWSLVEDVHVEGFVVDTKIIHTRQVNFTRFACWSNNVGVAVIPLQITTNGWFTGDLNFDDTCQFVSNSATLDGTKCIQISCTTGDYNNATGANQIAGIRFGNIDLYQGQRAVEIFCSNGGYISDIWFTETQWDQVYTTGLYIEADKNTATTPVIQNINLSRCYFSQSLGTTIDIISTSGGIVRDVDVLNSYADRSQNRFAKTSGTGTKNIVFDGNRLVNANFNASGAGYVFDIGATLIAQVTNNRADRTDGASFFDHLVRISTGANRYIVRNNNGGGLPAVGVILDQGGAVTKSVGDNI